MKIVFLPLDERPCNERFPVLLFGDVFEIAVPPKALLGDKKRAADTDGLIAFLKRECTDADILVCSLEMLLYGGLLPSRLHHLSEEILDRRLHVLEELKEKSPRLKIYAFSLIMRCPQYSSDEEEPAYYGVCGAEIHRLGALIHLQKLHLATDPGEEQMLRDKIGPENLVDYTERRAIDLRYVLKAVDLRRAGTIDCLLIPQDDSAPYGFTSMDREIVQERIGAYGLTSEILMYPGADEAALTLFTRCLIESLHRTVRVFVRYAADGADRLIPLYEDRPLGKTVRSHILAAGCTLAECDRDADLVLCLTSTAQTMGEAKYQADLADEYDRLRDMDGLLGFIKRTLAAGKAVSVADNAYANGGDLKLLAMLDREGLLPALSGYAGWNTDGNTIGTALSQGVCRLLRGATQAHFDFLALRYLEDFGYCSEVRFRVSDKLGGYGYNYFWVADRRGIVSRDVKAALERFLREKMPSVADRIEISDVQMPWRRMFEVGITAAWKTPN